MIISYIELFEMSKTVESKFLVKSVGRKDICLKDLNRGLVVFVESIDNATYNGFMIEKIKTIESGDIIKASLESQNKICTKWIIKDIKT